MGENNNIQTENNQSQTTATRKNNLGRDTVKKLIISGAIALLLILVITCIWGCSEKITQIVKEEELNTPAVQNPSGNVVNLVPEVETIDSILFEDNSNRQDSQIIHSVIINSEAMLPYAEWSNGNVSYYVDNTNIANVDEYGWIVSNNYGETTVHVYVTDEDGNVEEYVQVIQVGAESMVLSLFPSIMILDVGEIGYCVPYVYNEWNEDIRRNVNVTYTSTDPSIAMVDLTGKITAIAPGVTTVVVTAVNGNHVCEASMPVTVNGPHEDNEVHDSSYHNHYLVLDVDGSVDMSCTKPGTVRYSCACGYHIEEAIDALGHNYESVEVVQPTCTAAGYVVYECTRCKDRYTSNTGAARGHNYQPGNHVTPNCTTGGSTTYTCCNCGDSYTAGESALGHNYEAIQVVQPTCTEAGYIITECTRCKDRCTNSNGAALGHNYEKSNPTDDLNNHVCKCSRCGDSYTEGHTYPHPEYGVQGQTCTGCNWFHPIF